MLHDWMGGSIKATPKIVKNRKGGRSLSPAPYLTSTSTKDCRLNRRRDPLIRCETQVGVTGGFCANSDLIGSHAFENMSNGDRMKLARRILGPDASKNAIRKLARYGKGI